MMKNLVIWAHSYCRSTLAFYRGLGMAFASPLKIILINGFPEERKKVGFSGLEFSDLDISVYEGLDYASNIFKTYYDSYHIFGSYQSAESIALIDCAIKNGIRFGICSEAPCNMSSFPKRILKDLYIRFILPQKVKSVTSHADFIVNYSGDNSDELTKIGWDERKVIPCGYYSPPIIGSNNIHRCKANWENFIIMLSGIHQWHRSPIVLLKALKELNRRGVKYECNITQTGPQFEAMKKFVNKNNLINVHLLGFLPMQELIDNYEKCSVYVGAGNNEPWGMRLNDALQCGAPLVVNRGMGGCKLVDDYKCGLTFNRNNHIQLADALEKLISSYSLYQEYADAAFTAANKIKPEKKAAEIAITIKDIINLH